MINNLAKLIIILGAIIICFGFLLLLFSKVRIPYLGRLPGDIFIQKKNFTFYFPLTTSIILSIVLSIILYFIFKK